jgi:hypothetical protein
MYKPLTELIAEGADRDLIMAVAMLETNGFNPAEHPEDEVLIYAGENPDEIDAIIGIEEITLNRASLLSELRDLNNKNHEEDT